MPDGRGVTLLVCIILVACFVNLSKPKQRWKNEIRAFKCAVAHAQNARMCKGVGALSWLVCSLSVCQRAFGRVLGVAFVIVTDSFGKTLGRQRLLKSRMYASVKSRQLQCLAGASTPEAAPCVLLACWAVGLSSSSFCPHKGVFSAAQKCPLSVLLMLLLVVVALLLVPLWLVQSVCQRRCCLPHCHLRNPRRAS